MESARSDHYALPGSGKNEKDTYDDSKVLNSDGHVDSLEYIADGIHDGLVFPTEEERTTLRRVLDSIPWNAYLIAAVELAERFSFYGCSVVFTNFIQQPLPKGSHTGAGFADGQSGALGRGQQTMNGITTFYTFWCYITPLFGAYIADTYLGRFKTVSISVGIALIGHILLIISAIPGVIEKESALGAFMVALIIMGIGTGLFKANISPLIAEQYKRTRQFVVTTKNGERIIVDPALTVSRMYMYFYLFINIGALVGQIGMVYAEKYVGFWLSYTLPTCIFLFCPFILWYGRKRYTRSPPTGSVLATSLRLWRFATKGRWSFNPVKCYRQLTADDFWESAKPSKQVGKKPAWMTFDDQWVDEVQRGFKACGVFCLYPVYWLAYNQTTSNLPSQAATMSTHGLPNEIVSNLDPFALIILIPICDLFIYPALRRIGINFSALKKIVMGYMFGMASMIWAAVLQHYIYKTNPCHYAAATCVDTNGNPLVSPINVWAQTGPYVLVAISEILTSITGLEYAFTKAPTNMRSLVMAVFLFTSAIASALQEAFVPLVADPLLVWNYGVMAVLSASTGIILWILTRKLDAREDELNNLKQGHMSPNTSDA